jgi:hypothetical protein
VCITYKVKLTYDQIGTSMWSGILTERGTTYDPSEASVYQ